MHGFCKAKVTIYDDRALSTPARPEKGIDVDEYLKKVEANPRRKAALERARVRAAEQDTTRFSPLARLRMKAGISQKELALRMGSTQPFIARIERSAENSNLTLDTMENLSRALNCSVGEVATAASVQRRNRPTEQTIRYPEPNHEPA